MTKVWAHRGASAEAPENTLPAFELAIEQGADGLELDVQRTLDGHLVVIHDEQIDRTSDGVGRVAEMTLAELRRHTFSNRMDGFAETRLPTLEEVLDLAWPTRLSVNIELKNSVELYPGMEREVDALVRDKGFGDRVILSSFNHYSLRSLLEASEPLPLGVLLAEGLVDPWVYAQWLGASAIHPHALSLRAPGVVEACHEAGILVHAWTVDDPRQAVWLRDLGVDAIITNRPGLIARALADA